jgi:hypothetical protein
MVIGISVKTLLIKSITGTVLDKPLVEFTTVIVLMVVLGKLFNVTVQVTAGALMFTDN